jgi:hypothetical protein
MKPVEIVARFDRFLAERGHRFEGVVIGGAALALLHVITRETKDCDVLHPKLPDELRALSVTFARELRSSGENLVDDWFNNGPATLCDVLPKDWKTHLQPLYKGKALQLFCLGRLDLLRSKFFALCDRGTDLPDCLALAPTLAELHEILPWVKDQDGNPGWPDHVVDVVSDFAKRLGYEL